MGNTLTAETTNSKKTMELFPYALIRIGGDTYEQWADLQFRQSTTLTEEIFKLTTEQRGKKEKLCDDLFGFISSTDDADIQNTVQNLRRDIFNERKLKNSKVRKALEVLPEHLKTDLQAYLKLLAELKEKGQSGEAIYLRELKENRTRLKDIADTDPLKKGLILSSRTLLNRLEPFRKRPVEKFRKKEHQIEQSILQYLTRMYAKTSPFSTFTNLTVGQLADGVEEGIRLTPADGKEEVRGHIRLNNYLMKYLTDLLSNYRAAYMLFPLRINPTLQNRGDHFLYLTNNNNIESFQRIPYNPVVEHIANVVQGHAEGIRFSDLVETLKNDIDASGEELENYVQQLIGYGLLEYHLGVSGVDPDWDIKLTEALQVLVEHDIKHIADLTQRLKEVRDLGMRYAHSDVEERKEILQQAFDAFRGVCMAIHEEAGLPAEERLTEQERLEQAKAKREEQKKKEQEEGKETDGASGKKDGEDEEKKDEEVTFKHETSTFFTFKPEQIFYEDTTREVNAVLDKKQVGVLVSELHELLRQMRYFQGNQDEKDKMKAYFLEKYGEGEAVDLLTFYEDYFREFKKPEKEREEKRKKEARERMEKKVAAKVPAGDTAGESEEKEAPAADDTKEDTSLLPVIRERNEMSEKWRKALVSDLKSNVDWNEDLINVDLEPVLRANEEVALQNPGDHEDSYGSFLQFYNEGGKLKAVVNSTFPGYGKMISRFLHIFDKEVTEQTRSWNTAQCDDSTIFVEDCDASYFNANLHPTLMPYEVWMPGGHNSLPADKQIPITDFEITFSKEEGALNLKQKSTGKNAHVFDLGFQGHMGRSQLFQLLEKFTKAEYLFTQPFTNAINQINAPEKPEGKEEEKAADDKQTKEPAINVLPRIVYKDLLVLQRKSWYVPKPLLPQRHPNDSDWQFFTRVDLWRRENNMPDEVFVYVNPSRWGAENVEQEKMKKLTRDDYKPQYIDFTNPLLISLLEKLIDRVPVNMRITEMLPSSKQMLKVNGSRYVSEFVIQWYNKN